MLTDALISALDPTDRYAFGRRASVVTIVCNLVLVLCKGFAGIASGSISVIADALNNLLDALSGLTSLVGFALAGRPADAEHPLGHGRYEYVSGLVVSEVIIVTGFELGRESVARILHPVAPTYTTPALLAIALSVAIKLWLCHFLTRGAERIDSATLKATAADSRNDCIATSTVLAGALASRYAGLTVDGWLGLLVALFVLSSGISLLRDTLRPLIGSVPDQAQVERIRRRILSYPGVLDTHDLMVHDYGPQHRFASAHVEMSAETNPLITHQVIDRIEHELSAEENLSLVLHYDPVLTVESDQGTLRSRVLAAVRSVREDLTVHDLYLSYEGGTPHLTFDCVVPASLESEGKDIATALEKALAEELPELSCQVNLDWGYLTRDG